MAPQKKFQQLPISFYERDTQTVARELLGQRLVHIVRGQRISGVYLIYGMHHCFNVVTKSSDDPEAVLIRALEPSEGMGLMHSFRRVKRDHDLTNGPGKLCDALRIDKNLDRHSLRSPELFIEEMGPPRKKSEITAAPRIGVDYAGEAAAWPLRFYLNGNAFVSRT
jgi:DNA-3-methyladenine glycosylase